MKQLLTLSLLIALTSGFCQTTIEWSPNHLLQLEDFQSAQTEINPELTSLSIFSGSQMDFGYQMSTAEFMFTKNFNSKVTTIFNRKAAVITAPDSISALYLVGFGQYSFDLAELYSRKFRKEIFEQKGAFSNPNFFQPLYHKLQEEMNA